MNSMESLLLKIEQKRHDLLLTVNMYGLRSENTIQLSKDLDVLLNIYYNELKRAPSDFFHIGTGI
jgi:hypothetical protein